MKRKAFKPSTWVSLILWYVPVFFVQLVTTSVTQENLQPWYYQLTHPKFNPPAWVFGPVWVVIYILMAISIWTIYISKLPRSKKAGIYTLFWLQLILNAAWPFLFFQYHLMGLALIDLAVLAIVIYFLMASCFKNRFVAGLLLMPYFLWVLYAVALNATFWFLN